MEIWCSSVYGGRGREDKTVDAMWGCRTGGSEKQNVHDCECSKLERPARVIRKAKLGFLCKLCPDCLRVFA